MRSGTSRHSCVVVNVTVVEAVDAAAFFLHRYISGLSSGGQNMSKKPQISIHTYAYEKLFKKMIE
jgi:hypothetical protein